MSYRNSWFALALLLLWGCGTLYDRKVCRGDWCTENAPSFANYSALWGLSQGDLWVAGHRSDDSPAMAHWDGFQWSETPGIDFDVYGIWGAAGNDVWAVGTVTIAISVYIIRPTVAHWDGRQWTNVSSQIPQLADFTLLRGIWGFSSQDIYIGGGSLNTGDCNHGLIFHSDGTSWTTVFDWAPGHQTPELCGWGPIFSTIWGSTPSSVWASDRDPTLPGGTTIVNCFSPPCGVASNWQNDPDISFYGVIAPAFGGTSPSNVWLMGSDVFHFDGTSIDRGIWPQAGRLFGVWANRVDDAWSVGAQGQVLRFDGYQWLAQPSFTSDDIYFLWGSSGELWAGSATNLYHHGGMN